MKTNEIHSPRSVSMVSHQVPMTVPTTFGSIIAREPYHSRRAPDLVLLNGVCLPEIHRGRTATCVQICEHPHRDLHRHLTRRERLAHHCKMKKSSHEMKVQTRDIKRCAQQTVKKKMKLEPKCIHRTFQKMTKIPQEKYASNHTYTGVPSRRCDMRTTIITMRQQISLKKNETHKDVNDRMD